MKKNIKILPKAVAKKRVKGKKEERKEYKFVGKLNLYKVYVKYIVGALFINFYPNAYILTWMDHLYLFSLFKKKKLKWKKYSK